MVDEPSESTRRADEVRRTHDLIRERIRTGGMAPGETISQVQLAGELGVSRGPLREALRLLEREGFIEQEHNRRARVAPVSLSDLDQVYAMRITLEALAITLATPLQTPARLSRARELLAEMDDCIQNEDIDGWEGPHRAFHAALTAPAGPRLARELAALSDHADRYRRLAIELQPSILHHGVHEHAEILDAVEHGDGTQAALLLAKHLGRVALIVGAMSDSLVELTAVRQALRTVERTAPDPPG